MARHCRCCGMEVREHLEWCPLCSTRLVLPWRVRLLPWAVIALEGLATWPSSAGLGAPLDPRPRPVHLSGGPPVEASVLHVRTFPGRLAVLALSAISGPGCAAAPAAPGS